MTSLGIPVLYYEISTFCHDSLMLSYDMVYVVKSMLRLALKHNVIYYCVPRYIAAFRLLMEVVASALPSHICHTNKSQTIQRLRQNKTYPVEQHCPSIDHIVPEQDINKKANALARFVFAICDLQMAY